MGKKEVYVETEIEAPVDDVWEYTQNPSLHQEWDLRFSSITYMPKEANKPQKFTYTRRIVLDLKVSGWGESVGQHESKDGRKTSSLHFGTPQRISPIKEGRGFWQYSPLQAGETTKFLTVYNYESNYGKLGSFLDKSLFRPMMGWATALSFDVLKNWLEKGEAPKSQYSRFFISYVFTFLFAFIWIYHGLVPKIIASHPEELRMTGYMFSLEGKALKNLLTGIGIVEIIFGLVWLFYRQKRHLFALQCFLFPLLMTSSLIVDIGNASHPFSPVTFNLVLIVLSILGFILSKDLPSAKNCKRRRDQ